MEPPLNLATRVLHTTGLKESSEVSTHGKKLFSGVQFTGHSIGLMMKSSYHSYKKIMGWHCSSPNSSSRDQDFSVKPQTKFILAKNRT